MSWFWEAPTKYIQKKEKGAVIYDIDVDPHKNMLRSHRRIETHRFLCTAAYR